MIIFETTKFFQMNIFASEGKFALSSVEKVVFSKGSLIASGDSRVGNLISLSETQSILDNVRLNSNNHGLTNVVDAKVIGT